MARIVLVHGGSAGGWCWKKLTPLLQQNQHIVYAPTLTGLGERSHLSNPAINLDMHIADIKNLILYEDIQDVILVGHSYGGMVITGVAAALPERIAQLIYLDALVPENGESLLTAIDKETGDFFVSEAQQKGNGWLVPAYPLKDDEFNSVADVNWYKARFTGHPLESYAQKIAFSHETLKHIPTAFIHCIKNSHATLQKMKARAQARGWDCFEIHSNHFPMVDHAQELATLLLKIVNK